MSSKAIRTIRPKNTLNQTIKNSNSIRKPTLDLTEKYSDIIREFYDYALESSERIRLNQLFYIQPSKGNTLYSAKKIFDSFPSFFAGLSLELLLQIFDYLDLYDLRFLAMTSRSFYRNFYNPNGTIFDLIVQKLTLRYSWFQHQFNRLKQGFVKRRRLLIGLSGVGEFRYLSFISGNSLDIVGQYVKLWIPEAKVPEYQYISCFVFKRFQFSNIVVIPRPSITHEELVNLYQSPSVIRFKTIRHWLSQCLDCELYQVNTESLASKIHIFLSNTAAFPLHLPE